MENQTLFDRLGGAERLRFLLHHFYADVRQHHVIGPIFADHVRNWPEHIDKITSFWIRITGGTSGYAGNMPAKHLQLELKQEHFQTWLTLWEANCRTHLPPGEAKEMVQIAYAIGQRLQTILSNARHSWSCSTSKQKTSGARPLQASTPGMD